MNYCKLTILDEVNIKLSGLPADVRRAISNKLKFELPNARHMPQFKLGRWDGSVTYFNVGGTGYLNHLDVILSVLEKYNYTIDDIEDKRLPYTFDFDQITENYWADQGKVWPKDHRMEGKPIVLFDYQCDAVNNCLQNLQGLQIIPTAGGKTAITATLSHLCERYGRTMVIVPNKSLVIQTEADYVNMGLDVGVYFGDRKEIGKTHTIVTWQSLNVLDKHDREALSLAEFIDDVVCVIVDECHGVKGSVLRNLLGKNFAKTPIRWGLSGTLPKEDIHFHAILSTLGPVHNKIIAKDLQDKGVLSNCHVNVMQMLETKSFRSYPEEQKYLSSNIERMTYIANLCNDIKDKGNTLILVNYISSGKLLESMIPGSVFISGVNKEKDRKEQYDGFREEDHKVTIATFGIAAVGININRIFNLVLLEPGKSFIRVVQSIGRGLRKADDKDHVEIWDITSNCKFSKKHATERQKFYKESQYPFTVQKINWQK